MLCAQLRGVYFDRIERSSVEAVINSIYDHVISLEDIQVEEDTYLTFLSQLVLFTG